MGSLAMSDSFADEAERQMEFEQLYDKFMYGVHRSGGILQQDTRHKRRIMSKLLFSRRSTSDCEPHERFLEQADQTTFQPW